MPEASPGGRRERGRRGDKDREREKQREREAEQERDRDRERLMERWRGGLVRGGGGK